MREPSREIRFDPIEWENLVEFLKDCPGRICAAIVPGIDGGNALRERLPAELAPIPVHPAGNESVPAELGSRAVELGKSDAVFLIVLDGRRRFDTDEERAAFWQALNFQRESLVSGRLRTCFVLNQLNDGWMMRCADDLREWVRVFRFPEAFVRRDDLPLIMQTEDWKRFISDFSVPVPLNPLRDQLRRAREAGFSRDQLARDYAAPLFEALVVRGYFDEAKKIWHEDLYDGDALGNMPVEAQFYLFKKRFDEAFQEEDLEEMRRCSDRLRTLAKDSRVSLPSRNEMSIDASLMDGILLGSEKKMEEALAVFIGIIEEFSDKIEVTSEESLAAAFGYKALTLHFLQRDDEALSTCDKSIERFAMKRELGTRYQIVRLMALKRFILRKLGRMEEALAVSEDFLSLFGKDVSPEIRVQVAMALVDKGAILDALGQWRDAISVCNEVIDRFANESDSDMRRQVAMALFNKGVALSKLEQVEDTVSIYDGIVSRFRHDIDPGIRELVAKALFNKGATLGELGRNEEAIAAYDEVEIRFNEDANPEIGKQVAKAMVNRCFALVKLGREEEAIADYTEIVNRFGEETDPDIQESIARVSHNESNLLILKWRRTKDPEVLKQAFAAGRRAVELGGQHYNYACALALSGQHEEAFKQLEIALENKEIPWSHVTDDLDWKPLQDDPRYIKLKDRFGRDIPLRVEN